MATNVSGPLRLVTDQPEPLAQVRVRAPRPRPHAGGMVVDFTAPVSVADGVVSFPCVPGPAVLSVVRAGVPQITVPLVVPDTASASLEECMQAAGLADSATQSVLEDLARRVVEGVATAEQAAQTATGQAETATEQAGVASGHADAAAESAGVAKASEQAAKASEQAAKVSEQAAKVSETNAGKSEDNAKQAAQTATQKAKDAASHASSVLDSASLAGASAERAAASAETATEQANVAIAEADRARSEADRAAGTAASGVPDATAAIKGKVALAGDLAGTADAPTVPKLASKADLVGGFVPTSQLPAVSLTKPHVVENRAGMLALTVQEGDVAVITAGVDKGTYMLGAGASSEFSSWVMLAAPTDAVTSVNGQVGVVVLSASDVGAAPTSHTHTVDEITGLTGDLSGKADMGHTHDMIAIEGLQDVLSTLAPTDHTHAIANVLGLQSALDGKANAATVTQRPALFSGAGAPPASIPGAVVGDWWLDTSSKNLYTITGV